MATELKPPTLHNLAVEKALAEMQMKFARDEAERLAMEKIYQNLRDKHTAALVTARLDQANINSLKDFK